MRIIPLLGWAAVLGVAPLGGCEEGSSADYIMPRVVVEHPALPRGVKRFDHQTAPLADDPPVRFNRLFELRVPADERGFSRIAFSPDGKTIAGVRSGARQPWEEIFVFDIEKQTLLYSLRDADGKGYDVAAMAFLPTGDRLATASRDMENVYVWDVRKGALTRTIDSGGKTARGVTDLAVFPDGRRLVWSIYSGLYLLDVETGAAQRLPLEGHLVVKPGNPPVPPHCSWVTVTADGSRFATTVSDIVFFEPAILVWDASTMGVTRTIPTEMMCVGVAMAPDGKRVAASQPGKTGGATYLTIWDAASGKPLVSGHVFAAGSPISFSRDGKYLFAAGKHLPKGPPDDAVAVGVWDTATGRLVGSLTTGKVYCTVALSPDNKRLAVGASNIDIYAIEYCEDSKPSGDAPPTAKP
jgi:WD40 repeat protein